MLLGSKFSNTNFNLGRKPDVGWEGNPVLDFFHVDTINLQQKVLLVLAVKVVHHSTRFDAL